MTKRVDFDNYVENYNQLLKDKTQFFSSSEEYFAKYKVDVVRAHVNSPVKRLLEYGCGIGRNIPFLRRAFPDASVVGSDISAASLECARRNNPGIEFIHEVESPESVAPFDLIFVAGVFHHVPPEQRLALSRTLQEHLSPGGTLFVFEHNPYNPITRRIVSGCPYDEDAVLLKPSELRGLLQDAGLIVERTSYCLFVPPRLSWLSPLENWFGWLPFGGQYWIHARRCR